jgi:hypothetical protein
VAKRKKVTARPTLVSAADLKSRLLTQIIKDIAADTPAGYDRTPGVHDRYGKAGASNIADMVSNPADLVSRRGGR